MDWKHPFGRDHGARPPAPIPTTEPKATEAAADTLPADAGGEPRPALDFSDWVRRSDCRGRMGWERPGLPDDVAWWRWADFDDLPTADWTCPECGGPLWWEDLLGGKHCLRCEFDKHERSASTLRSVQASGVIPPQR